MAPRRARPEPRVHYPFRHLTESEIAAVADLRRQQRLQEMAWIYREHGMERHARHLEEELAARLAHYTEEDVRWVEPLSGDAAGITSTVRITFHDGTVAYFKAAREYQALDPSVSPEVRAAAAAVNHRAEIAAHRFDQLLSRDVVPTTVEWEFHGQVGSLQLGMTASAEVPSTAVAIRFERRMRLLDLLMGNPDRHGNNRIWVGRWAGIDHGLAFDLRPCDGILVSKQISVLWSARRTALRAELAALPGHEHLSEAQWHRLLSTQLHVEFGPFIRALLETPAERWTETPAILERIGAESAGDWRVAATNVKVQLMVPDLATYDLIRGLNREVVRAELGTLLTEPQLEAIMSRRDRLVQRVERLRQGGWLFSEERAPAASTAAEIPATR